MADSLATKAITTILVRGAGQLVTVVSGIVITRHLGPTDRGLYVYALTVLLVLAAFGGSGAGAAAWQWVIRGERLQEVYATSVVIQAALIVPTTIALILAAVMFPQQRVLVAVAACVPPTLYALMTNGLFLATGDVGVTNVQYTIGRLAPALTAIVMLLTPAHLGVALAIWALGQLAVGLHSAIALRRRLNIFAVRTRRDLIVGQIRWMLPVIGVNTVDLLKSRVDTIVILAALGPAALGIYSVAIAVAELLMLISRNVHYSAYGPILNASEGRTTDLLGLCIRHVFLLTLIAAVILWFAGPSLIVLFFGSAFAGAAPALRVLLIGLVLWSAYPFMEMMLAVKRSEPTRVFQMQAIGAVTCATLTLALVHPLGMLAGAIGTSAGYAATTAIAVVWFLRGSKVSAASIFSLRRTDFRYYGSLIARTRKRGVALHAEGR